jgi:hypothetical protein
VEEPLPWWMPPRVVGGALLVAGGGVLVHSFARFVVEGLGTPAPVLYKKRGIGMFVSPTARDALRAQRRETFFSDVVDPMVAEAKAVGIPIGEVIARIEHLDGKDDR